MPLKVLLVAEPGNVDIEKDVCYAFEASPLALLGT